jgi:hypothetical protein
LRDICAGDPLNLRTAPLPPHEIEEIQMQKAQLYEAIFIVNRGIDDAVRGLERLKRTQDSGLDPAYIDEKLTLFEVHRALLNGCFCNKVESSEQRDEARFEKRHREYEKKALDEVLVHRDVEAVEESRRLEGKAPRVRFLGSDEQQDWEQQHPNSRGQSERRGENDHAQKA